jgi:hypothetical protein
LKGVENDFVFSHVFRAEYHFTPRVSLPVLTALNKAYKFGQSSESEVIDFSFKVFRTNLRRMTRKIYFQLFMFIFFAHTKKTEPKESVPGSLAFGNPAVGGIPSPAYIFGGSRKLAPALQGSDILSPLPENVSRSQLRCMG